MRGNGGEKDKQAGETVQIRLSWSDNKQNKYSKRNNHYRQG